MRLLSALIFSFCANIDNIMIGITYGLNRVCIQLKYNLIISLFISFTTYLSMTLGNYIFKIIPIDTLSKLSCWILICWGCVQISNAIFDHTQETIKPIKKMTLKQAVILSLILAFNNAAVGISANIAGVDASLTFCCTLIISVCFLHVGQILGKKCPNAFKAQHAQLLSGILLIILGLLETFI